METERTDGLESHCLFLKLQDMTVLIRYVKVYRKADDGSGWEQQGEIISGDFRRKIQEIGNISTTAPSENPQIAAVLPATPALWKSLWTKTWIPIFMASW